MGTGPDDGYFAGSPTPPPPPPPPGTPPPPWGQQPGGGLGSRRAGLVPMHPMTLADILDSAFKLFRATAVTAILTVLVVYGPLNLLASIPGAAVNPFDPFAPQPSGGALALALIAGLASVLVNPLVTGAVTWIAVQRERGVEVTWQDALRAAGSRYGSLLGAVLLIGLIAVAAVAVAAIPAVVLGFVAVPLGVLLGVVLVVPVVLAIGVLFYLVVPVIVLEGAGAWDAIKRSVALVRPRLWPTVGIVIVAGILIGIVGGILGFGFGLVGALLGPVGFILSAIGSTLSSVVTVPLSANVALLVYLDARIRHEGFDIEVLTADLPRG